MCAKKRSSKHESVYRAQYYSDLRREQERGAGGDEPLEFLMDAASRKDRGMLGFLAREIGINYTEDGKNALFWMAGTNDLEAAWILIEAGAKVGPTAEGAASPLMHAAFRNQLDMAKLLIEHGAQVHYADANGDSALSIAEQRGHLEMVALLRDLAK